MLRKLIPLFLIALASTALAAETTSPKKARKAKSSKSLSKVSAVEKSATADVGSPSTKHALSGSRVRPLVGLNFFSPKALNNHLGQIAAANNIGSSLKIGTGPAVGVHAEYPITKNFFAGLRLEYLAASSDTASVGTGKNTATLQAGLASMPVMATASYITEVAPKVSVGSSIGAGVPIFNRAYLEISDSTIAGLPSGELSYSSNPFTMLFSAFGEYAVNPAVALRLEGGYRLLSSSQMKLEDAYGDQKAGSLLKDQNNANVKVNANSFVTSLSMVVTL